MGLLGLFLFIFVSNDCFKNAGAYFFLVNNFKFLNKMKTFIILVLKIKLIISNYKLYKFRVDTHILIIIKLNINLKLSSGYLLMPVDSSNQRNILYFWFFINS